MRLHVVFTFNSFPQMKDKDANRGSAPNMVEEYINKPIPTQ